MNPKLRDAWTSVHRAESLLVQAAVHQNPTLRSKLFEGLELDLAAKALLVRMVHGFDSQNLRARDYVLRYPFSSVEAVQAGIEHLVQSGVAVAKGAGVYAITELGERAIRRYMEKVSFMMQSLDLGDLAETDALRLLDYDRRILEALRAALPRDDSIFGHRLRGLHPSYDPPALWHHWQLAWTMGAASEDAEQYVCKLRGLAPMVWFVRRQIWFAHRRPWRARALTLEALVRRATGYSPIDQAEKVCAQAIEELQERAWLQAAGKEYRLTEQGLAVCDQDERELDERFLSSWPAFSDDEVQELLDVTARLNERCTELIRQAKQNTL